MAELTVDMTYGNALYEAGCELGMRDTFLREGQELSEIIDREPELDAFLKDPVVSENSKKTVLKNIFEGQISREMMNFLFILIDKGRAGRFTGIIREYRKLADKADGVADGRIISAAPLTEEQLAGFEDQVSDLFRIKVRLKNETDRSLIGGVRIFVNGRMIDTSLRKRLDDMADSFRM